MAWIYLILEGLFKMEGALGLKLADTMLVLVSFLCQTDRHGTNRSEDCALVPHRSVMSVNSG